MNNTQITEGLVENKIMIIVFLVIIVIIIVVSVMFGGKDDNPSSPLITNQPSQSSQIMKVGKVKTLYRFDDYWDKIIRVDAKSDAEFYPKGGKVKVTTSSGNWYISTPGTSEVRPQKPNGIFTFERKDSIAWGMEIWQ